MTTDPLDPAIVEKAAKALHDMRSRRSCAFHEIGQPLGDTVYDDERRADARAALDAVADDLRAEGAAQALREAAGSPIPRGALARETRAWLNSRADALEAGQS